MFNAKRSISLEDVSQTMDPSDLHEATPLLLQARLNVLLKPPKARYKRVGKVIGKIGKLEIRIFLS